MSPMTRAQHPRHRRQQPRFATPAGNGLLTAALQLAKPLNPIDLRLEHQDLAKDVGDAGNEDAEDDPINPRVPHKGRRKRFAQRRRKGYDQHEKQCHANQKPPRAVHRAGPQGALNRNWLACCTVLGLEYRARPSTLRPSSIRVSHHTPEPEHPKTCHQAPVCGVCRACNIAYKRF